MESTVTIPEKVKVNMDNSTVTVEGPGGKATRTFTHPRITIAKEGDTLKLKTESVQKKDRAVFGTWVAHLKNMISGAEKSYEYRLKVLFTHFPITVKQQDNKFIITNYMGEKGIKTANLMPGVKAVIQKEDITLTGPSKEDVGQTAANLEKSCRQKTKDIRVFQDGIYITKKG